MNTRSLLSVSAATASFLLVATRVCAGPAALDPHIVHWLSFDVPGSTYTQGSAINDFGEVAGDYADANGIFHSFLRKADGAIVTFDPPGAGTGNASGIVSVPTGINKRGDIVGYYLDSGTPFAGTHGFVRGRTADSLHSTTRMRTLHRPSPRPTRSATQESLSEVTLTRSRAMASCASGMALS